MTVPFIKPKFNMRMKCSLLLYTAIIRLLIAYACPVWAAASKTKIIKNYALQNKFLKTALNAPCSWETKQLHNGTGLLYLYTWITQQFKNFHEKLHEADGALHYDIGRGSANLRLKPRLPQDILLEPEDDTSNLDNDLYSRLDV